MRAIYLLAFIVVVAIVSEAESGILSSNFKHVNYEMQGQNAKYFETNQKFEQSYQTGTAASRTESHPLSGRKWGFSAWGIIALILGVIIFSTLTYYVFMLYPYICKKDAAYDIIELTEVNSVCTVSDNVNNVPHLRVYCDSNDASNDASLNR